MKGFDPMEGSIPWKHLTPLGKGLISWRELRPCEELFLWGVVPVEVVVEPMGGVVTVREIDPMG